MTEELARFVEQSLGFDLVGVGVQCFMGDSHGFAMQFPS